VIADVAPGLEFPVEESFDQIFGGLRRGAKQDVDLVSVEKGQRATSHATCNDQVHAALSQPGWQKPRLVLGRSHDFLAGYRLGFQVNVKKDELRAMTEVGYEPAACYWDSDAHCFVPF
jgi:hypothetical protein